MGEPVGATPREAAASARPVVLCVDDEVANLELMRRTLDRECEVVCANSGEEALEIALARDDLAVVLTDFRMQGLTGVEVLASFAVRRPLCARVLVTGLPDGEHLVAAINEGGVQRVVAKPWRPADLRALVMALAEEHRHARAAGGVDASAAQDAAERRAERAEARVADLEDRLAQRGRDLATATVSLEQLSLRLERASFRDPLTGLYNHQALQERLREEVARSQRHATPLALLACDLDDFKAVNRDVGHQVGDEILRRIAALLADGEPPPRGRSSDIVARISGEEFALILPETHKAGALTKALRLRDAVAQAALPGGRAVTMSIGVATCPDDATDPAALLAAATAALAGAKRTGHVHFYDTSEAAEPGRGERRRPASIAQIALPSVELDRFRPYHDRLGEVLAILQRDRALSCMLLDLSRLRRVELELGLAHHAEIFDRAGAVLDGLRGTVLGARDLICRTPEGDAYLVFPSPAPGEPRLDLDAMAAAVEQAVEQALAPVVDELLRDQARLAIGCARVLGNSMIRPERLLSRLVSEAQDAARLAQQRAAQRDKRALQDIILGDGIVSVYQPIVHFGTGEIFGFEALARGPAGSALHSPAALFAVADEVDLTFELDRACFRRAVRSATGLEPVHRLFLNLLPLSFYDAAFIEIEIGHLLAAAGLAPANVVFEITEKLAIENFTAFRRALAAYAAMGFGVAIDDVGTRHSNLETVMALRPDFIKLSDVLTRGCARSAVKREMLRSMCHIADAIDAAIVAEGIETADDLWCLRDLGVRYGQGYFLARPGPPFPAVTRDARDAMASASAALTVGAADFDDDGDLRGEPPLAVALGSGATELPQPLGARRWHRPTAAAPAAPGPWRPLALATPVRAGQGDAPLVDTLRNRVDKNVPE
ncbi:MAG: EAL domain-containing protein [Kofleriaceae bacterium]